MRSFFLTTHKNTHIVPRLLDSVRIETLTYDSANGLVTFSFYTGMQAGGLVSIWD